LAGAPGFEPGDGGIKIRCLTTWLRPIARADHTGAGVAGQMVRARPPALPWPAHRALIPSPHIIFLAARLNRDKSPNGMRRRVLVTAPQARRSPRSAPPARLRRQKMAGGVRPEVAHQSRRGPVAEPLLSATSRFPGEVAAASAARGDATRSTGVPWQTAERQNKAIRRKANVFRPAPHQAGTGRFARRRSDPRAPRRFWQNEPKPDFGRTNPSSILAKRTPAPFWQKDPTGITATTSVPYT
jgi:hypothetical protein